MTKRGQAQVGHILWELIGLILVLIFIIGIIVLVYRAVGFGTGSQEQQATEFAFFSLASRFNEYVNSPAPFLPKEDFIRLPLFIDDDFMIVGFSKGKEKSVDGCGSRETVSRPKECFENACICLYPQQGGTDDFDNEDEDAQLPIACAQFPTVDFILGIWYYDADGGARAFQENSDVPTSEKALETMLGQCRTGLPVAYTDLTPQVTFKAKQCGDLGPGIRNLYSSLSIYGQCGAFGTEFRQDTIYVEKVEIDGKVFLLIAKDFPVKIVNERRKEVERMAFVGFFNAGEDLFKEGKYEDAIKKYVQYVEIAKDTSGQEGTVQKARFKITESYYQSGNYLIAAEKIIEYMETYNISRYFIDVGNVEFTTVPLPDLKAWGSQYQQEATIERKNEIKERFENLHNADPNNAVITYILGHIELEIGTDEFLESISLLKSAATTLKPNDIVHPLFAQYDLGESYLEQEKKRKLTTPEVISMLTAFRTVVDNYKNELELLGIYNNAHTKLAFQCNRWQLAVDVSVPCSGIPLLSPLTNIGIVYAANDCAPSGIRRCWDLARAHSEAILTCTQTESDLKWRALADKCPDNQYCRNVFEAGELSANCFTPVSVPDVST